MSEIMCKKCPECGLISDSSQKNCICGTDLTNIPEIMVDIDLLPSEQMGVVDITAQENGGIDMSDFLDDFSDFDEPAEDTTKSTLVFSAVRYGVHTFKITPQMVKDTPYMLGRAAGQNDFLKKDERVSNNHCTIFCNNGTWYVQDNSSTNGTFINDEDLGDGGCTNLENGDRVKLGHSADSMEFTVSIEE